MLMNMANFATDIFSKQKTFETLTHVPQNSTKWGKKSVNISVALFPEPNENAKNWVADRHARVLIQPGPRSGKKTVLGKKTNRPRCRKMEVSILGRWWWCCEDSSEMDPLNDLTNQ